MMKMKMASVCRICLAGGDGNTRLYAVKNKLLLFQYKQLTKIKFNSKDSRPRALCCFCYQKLLKCHIFSQMALRSEKMFSNIYDKGPEVTHDHITALNIDMKQHLYVTATQFDITLDGNDINADLQDQVTVKDEPLPVIDIKQEVSTESDKFVEIGSSLEDCKNGELILKEDNNYQDNDVEDLTFGIHVEQTRPDNSKTSFSCNDCYKVFYIKSKLITHVRNSHSQVKRKQYSSTKKHTKKTSVIETIQNLNNKFTCHVCHRSFVCKTDLINHLIVHTGKKRFACNLCDKQFNQKSYLVAHIKTHTGEKPFACNLCKKQFNYKGNLVEHMKTHTGEKLFACNVCKKQFCRKSVLVYHMTTHLDEKPLACHVCDKRFCFKQNLYTHQLTHTGEKPFTCHVCGKQFYLNHRLVRHMAMHSRVKRFTCNVCDKQFSRKDYLATHFRIHTGEKPYACTVCNKQFAQKSNSVLHMRTHTGEKTSACNASEKKINHTKPSTNIMRTHTGKPQT